MARKEIEQLIDKWVKDGGFRAQVRKDPEGTMRGTGVKFTDDEWAAFRKIDWKLSDDELKTRASKAFG